MAPVGVLNRHETLLLAALMNLDVVVGVGVVGGASVASSPSRPLHGIVPGSNAAHQPPFFWGISMFLVLIKHILAISDRMSERKMFGKLATATKNPFCSS